MNKQDFDTLITKLIALGENTDELRLWQKIFDDLTEDERRELVMILEEELGKLEALKDKRTAAQ